MNLFVAEDEAPALERLLESIARVAPHARIAGTAGSVREAGAWLAAHPLPDLLLLDIQLADGLSLELFAEGAPARACPTIFTTAYDEFALAAFRAHAVDYLLKPVDEARLAAAFEKHATMRRHFAGALAGLIDAFGALPPAAPRPARAPAYRGRILGRQGRQWIALAVEDVSCFVSVDKLAFAVTADGRRCLVEGALSDLERELDPAQFFRVNRQTLVNAAAVARFEATGKGRLVVALKSGVEEIAVSPERAPAFRAWLGGRAGSAA